jgi:hypothetical protein
MTTCKVGPKVTLKKVHFGKHDAPKTSKYFKGTDKPMPATPPAHAGAVSGFDYPTTLVGTTQKWKGSDGQPVTVYYDPSTGPNGLALAQDVLSRIDDMMLYFDWAFAFKAPGGGNVIIANTGGGAYHMGCDFPGGGDWYEDVEGAVTAAGQPGGICDALVAAEVTESYMGSVPANQFNCGGSGGEALSRVFSEIVSGGSGGAMGVSGYAAGPSWDGTDWISKDSGTDQDYPSTGCGTLYLWWMMSQGYTIDKIVQTGQPDGSFASGYAILTGKPASQAFSDFTAAVAAVGGPGSMSGDNPFNAPQQAYPLSGPVSPPPPVGPPPPPPVGPPPPPPIPGTLTLAAVPNTGLAPLSVTFTADGANSTGTLNFGDGSPAEPMTVPGTLSHSYGVAGDYIGHLTAGASAVSASVHVTSVAPPGPAGGTPFTLPFTGNFPAGGMTKKTMTDWIASSVSNPGSQFTLPNGVVCTLTEVIPPVEAIVEPIKGTGTVAAWVSAYVVKGVWPASDPGALNPAVFADMIALFFAFMSKNPVAIATALAKLLADLGIAGEDVATIAAGITKSDSAKSMDLPTILADLVALEEALGKLLTDLGITSFTGLQVVHSSPVTRSLTGGAMKATFTKAAPPANLTKHKAGDVPPVNFGLLDDNGDTVTVTGLTAGGQSRDISGVATLTAISSDPTVVALGTPVGMTVDEEGLKAGTADISLVATWIDGSVGPFTFTYTDTVKVDPVTGISIAHGPITVRP